MPTLQFSSVSEFLLMGSYTFHVWLVYLLFAIFVSYNLITPGVRQRQFVREQQRRAARDAELASRLSSAEDRSQ
jgi:heme exporter protein CcmD